MKEFTRKNIHELRKDLESVLEVVANQSRISLTLGSITYSNGEFKAELTGLCLDDNGKIVNPIEKAYAVYKNKNMLELGDSFTLNGDDYTIAGWKPRASKYPLIGLGKNGKFYKFSRKYAYKPGKVPPTSKFF